MGKLVHTETENKRQYGKVHDLEITPHWQLRGIIAHNKIDLDKALTLLCYRDGQSQLLLRVAWFGLHAYLQF